MSFAPRFSKRWAEGVANAQRLFGLCGDAGLDHPLEKLGGDDLHA
jgi:hypothetical protein